MSTHKGTFKCAQCRCEKRPCEQEGHTDSHGGPLCDYCFVTYYLTCPLCERIEFRHEFKLLSTGAKICLNCTTRPFRCAECEVNVPGLKFKIREASGPICRVCITDRQEAQLPISGHSWKPRPKFYGKDRGGLFYGVELEVDLDKECRDNNRGGPGGTSNWVENSQERNEAAAKALKSKVPFIYIKRDGSVPDGMEIVTQPLSMSWIRENKTAFDPIFKLVREGYASHDGGRCGMHIHMSKSSFTNFHLYKFLSFFYNNPGFILTISQRGTLEKLNQWSRIRHHEYGDIGWKNALTRMAREKSQTVSRYKAVNLSNEHTVEIRIFRGTLKRERFFKNLEFCQALYEFTMTHSEAECTYQRFIKFVSLFKREFPNLYAFLEERLKFRLLKPHKGRSKRGRGAGLRYEGQRDLAYNDDVSDVTWEDTVTEKSKQKADAIQARIAAARKAKELTDASERG